MDRVGNQVLDVLTGVLSRNINLSHLGFVTFTFVDVAPDLRTAKVFYSVLGRKKSDEEINIDINQKRKAFKKFMSPELQLRNTPDLHFYHDESLLYGDKINKLLHNIDLDKNEDGPEHP
jgi:ribosome-binding factor A